MNKCKIAGRCMEEGYPTDFDVTMRTFTFITWQDMLMYKMSFFYSMDMIFRSIIKIQSLRISQPQNNVSISTNT